MSYRYDNTQNASSPVAASALAAGDVVGLNSDGNPIKFGTSAVGAPVGVAQTSAAIGDIVEYATGAVAVLFPDGATAGHYAQATAAGVVTSAAAPTEAIRLGVVLTSCEEGGRAVVAWDVDYVEPVEGD